MSILLTFICIMKSNKVFNNMGNDQQKMCFIDLAEGGRVYQYLAERILI